MCGWAGQAGYNEAWLKVCDAVQDSRTSTEIMGQNAKLAVGANGPIATIYAFWLVHLLSSALTKPRAVATRSPLTNSLSSPHGLKELVN